VYDATNQYSYTVAPDPGVFQREFCDRGFVGPHIYIQECKIYCVGCVVWVCVRMTPMQFRSCLHFD